MSTMPHGIGSYIRGLKAQELINTF